RNPATSTGLAGSARRGLSDDDRPLDDLGQAQALALGPLLSLFKPVRVFAAPLARCIDTVAPIGLPVWPDTVLAANTQAPAKAIPDHLRALVAEFERIVVSSQGGVIPGAVQAMHPRNATAGLTYAAGKGAAWVLSFSGNDLLTADPLDLSPASYRPAP